MQHIDSVQNTQVKEWAKLHQKKYRMQQQRFIVEGWNLVKEACKADIVDTIISLDEVESEFPLITVSEPVLAKLTQTMTPQSVLAVCELLKPELPEQLDRVLVLDGLQDPGNMGTLIRSACAFNVDAIFITDDSVDCYNDKLIRATQGALFHIPIFQESKEAIAKTLAEHEVPLLLAMKEGSNVATMPAVEKWALVLGNEGQGIRPFWTEMETHDVTIPMSDATESLNVAIAGSILLWSLSKDVI